MTTIFINEVSKFLNDKNKIIQYCIENPNLITIETLDFLLTFMDINESDSEGYPFLYKVKDITVLEYALSKGFDLINVIKGKYGIIYPRLYNILDDKTVLDFAIKNGFDINQQTIDGYTLFHNGQSRPFVNNELVEYAIDIGFNPNLICKYKTTIFQKNGIRYPSFIVEKALHKGYNPNLYDYLFIHEFKNLLELAISKGLDICRTFNYRRATSFPIELLTVERFPVLFCLLPRIPFLKKAIEMGFDINSRDKNGNTVLHKEFDTNILKFALENGFDINSVNNDGDTIFHTYYAGKTIHYAIANGFKLVKNKKGQTIFHKQLKYIEQLDMDDPDITDDEGKTILCYCNTMEMFIKLIELGFAINSRDENGQGVGYKKDVTTDILHTAIENGFDLTKLHTKSQTVFQYDENDNVKLEYYDAIKLITHSAKLGFFLTLRNKKNVEFTTLFYCSTLELFIKAVEIGFDLNYKNTKGDTVFHKKHVTVDILQKAIENGFDINSINKNGDTIFHTHYSDKTIRFAIENGFDISIKNKKGQTIFHTQPKYLEQITMENPNDIDNEGNTVFFYCRSLPLFRTALIDGTDPTIRNKKGMTFLTYAHEDGASHFLLTECLSFTEEYGFTREMEAEYYAYFEKM